MTMLTLGEEAKLTGLGKTTPAGLVEAKRLSETRRDDRNYEIDPAELHRAYPFPAPREAPDTTVAATGSLPHPATVNEPTAFLEAEITGLREMSTLLRRQLDDVKEERDRWRAQAERLALRGQEPEKKRLEPEKRSRWAWLRSTG